MTESFIGNRIAELVKVKKISTIKMSEDLAQSKDYIDNIIELYFFITDTFFVIMILINFHVFSFINH